MDAAPRLVDTADLALRILASRGTSAYLAYLVQPGAAADSIEDVAAELRALDPRVAVSCMSPSAGAARLLHELPLMIADVLLIGAESFDHEDWSTLDRRRSALAHQGVTVFFTTLPSFSLLMRAAPNVASWLAGLVFSAERGDEMANEQREHRLAALRAWAGMTDAEVVLAAGEGRLPRDPEYAEWLVLIGRGDLLDAR